MARRRTIGRFASQQLSKLLKWIILCGTIAYVLAWFIGTIIELLAGGDIVSPLWVLGW